MNTKPIKLIVIHNPLEVDKNRRILSLRYTGQDIKDLIDKYASRLDQVICFVNQIKLEPKADKNYNYQLGGGDEVVIIPAVKDISMAIIAAVNWVEAVGIPMLVTAAIWAGIAYGSAYLYKSLGSDLEADAGSGQSFTWSGITTQQAGLAIPRAYGRNKLYGNIIAAWVEPDGYDETMSMLLSLGEGPVEGIVDDTIQVNDQPVGSYDNVETTEQRGLINQDAIFEALKLEYRPDRPVKHVDDGGGPVTWVTPDNDFDLLEIAIKYSGFYYQQSGKRKTQTVGIKIEISEHDADSWTTLAEESLVCDIAEQQKNYLSTGTYTGGTPVTVTSGNRYDIKVTRTNSGYEWDDGRKARYSYLSSVREVINTAFTYPNLALLGIEALATDQISGSLKVSCEQEGRIVNVYNGSKWTLEYSNNPAWIIWDILTQPVILGDGEDTPTTPYSIVRYDCYDPSRLLPYLDKWYEAAQHFDDLVDDGDEGTEKRITFNGVFDAGTNVWDAVQKVCAMARCEVVPVGMNFTIVVDKPWSGAAIQLFSAGNIKQGTFKLNYLSMEDRAAEVEISYLDSEQDYEQTPLLYYDPAIGTPNKKLSVNGFGITKTSQAWRTLYFELAKNRLTKYSPQFEADIDAIVCAKGDVVSVMPPWKRGGRVIGCPAANQIILDSPCMDTGSDTIVVRVHDPATGADSIETHTVNSVNGALLTISDTWTINPKKDDLYDFGPTGHATKKFRIKGISEGGDFTHIIECDNYDEDVYGGDDLVPDIPESSYINPSSSSPSQTRPPTTGDINQTNPIVTFEGESYDTPMITNLEWTDNDPGAGSVSWSQADAETDILICLNNSSYEITEDNSSNKYIYWDETSPTVLQGTDNLCDATGDGKWLICINDNGYAHPNYPFKTIHGAAVKAGPILDKIVTFEGEIIVHNGNVVCTS